MGCRYYIYKTKTLQILISMDDSLIIQNDTNEYWTQRWRNFKILFTGLEWMSSLNSKFSHIFFFEQVMFFTDTIEFMLKSLSLEQLAHFHTPLCAFLLLS